MKSQKTSPWTEFEKGLLNENPVFVLLIGLCSSLAVSANVSSALAMGLAVLCVLTSSNIIISIFRHWTPEAVRVPVFIITIAGFTTIVEILMRRYSPTLYGVLGVYLPLIVVNCIILGRAEAFASKNTVFRSCLDGLGMGVGYTCALVSIAILRELLGNGTLSFQIAENMGIVLNFTHPVLQDPNNPLVNVVNLFGSAAMAHPDLETQHLTIYNIAHIVPDPLQIMKLPPGGFLVMGLYLTILQHLTLVKAKKKALASKQVAKAEQGE
ncbi:MAG: electron transport complex subunit RsxE [Brevinema sp.]